MDIKQGIETQRLRLLRLLAGWLFAVGFLSAAPVASAWSLWVREWVFSLLLRAEAAAMNLVFVQACLLARKHGGKVDRGVLAQQAFALGSDELPSLEVLRRRLKALRRLLNNIPRHALRLLRRSNPQAAASKPQGPWSVFRITPRSGEGGEGQGFAPGLWDPPETACSYGLPFR